MILINLCKFRRSQKSDAEFDNKGIKIQATGTLTGPLPVLSMDAHSESKRAFLLLGLAECVAPTQEWPLTVSPTGGQPWDDSKMHSQNGEGDLRKIHGEFEVRSSSAKGKSQGANPLCAGTCSGRNVPESNLARSDTQQRRSVGRPESPLPLTPEELQNLHRGFPSEGGTDRWVYAAIHGFVARFCHITEHTEEALALAFTLIPSV